MVCLVWLWMTNDLIGPSMGGGARKKNPISLIKKKEKILDKLLSWLKIVKTFHQIRVFDEILDCRHDEIPPDRP